MAAAIEMKVCRPSSAKEKLKPIFLERMRDGAGRGISGNGGNGQWTFFLKETRIPHSDNMKDITHCSYEESLTPSSPQSFSVLLNLEFDEILKAFEGLSYLAIFQFLKLMHRSLAIAQLSSSVCCLMAPFEFGSYQTTLFSVCSPRF